VTTDKAVTEELWTMNEAGVETGEAGTDSAGMKAAHTHPGTMESTEASMKAANAPAVKKHCTGRGARQSRGSRQHHRSQPSDKRSGNRNAHDPRSYKPSRF
jgi:hypothetical protein